MVTRFCTAFIHVVWYYPGPHGLSFGYPLQEAQLWTARPEGQSLTHDGDGSDLSQIGNMTGLETGIKLDTVVS